METIALQGPHGQRQAYLWTPDGPPWAIVQVLHGAAEHMLRYSRFAQYLCAQGVAVCGADHAGHGTGVDADDRGYFGDENGVKIMCDDTDALRELIHSRFPDVPYFMLGHSMGSFVLRRYILDRANGLAGVMLSGTGSAPALAAPGLLLARLIAKLFGRRHRTQLVHSMAYGGYNKHFNDREPTRFDWLSRDKAIVRSYIEDEACGFLFTASAFVDIIVLTREIKAAGWYDKVPKDLPIWLFAGDMDPLGNRGRDVKEIYQKLRKAGVENTLCTLYSGGRHEMLNELNREQVYDDMLEWLHANT